MHYTIDRSDASYARSRNETRHWAEGLSKRDAPALFVGDVYVISDDRVYALHF